MKNDRPYIDHILEAISKIQKYTEGTTKEEFEKDSLLQDAVMRNIGIIGEATKRLSKKFREERSNIPWRDMSGMRDKLIHDYVGVDLDVVWRTVKEDIPVLHKAFTNL